MVASTEVQINGLCDQAQKQAVDTDCLERQKPVVMKKKPSTQQQSNKSAPVGSTRVESNQQVMCPVTTTSCISDRERKYAELGPESLELRAYKLGKGKCSYNMVQVDFLNGIGGDKTLEVVEANEKRRYSLSEDVAESNVSYELTLRNHSKILLNVYVVYSQPQLVENPARGEAEYSWKLVTRKLCKRGCKGPILRAIQRFGKLGKRCSEIWNSHYSKQDASKESSKDHRFLFISIDEACTHVSQGDKKTRFRLLFSVEDAKTGESIGSAVSAPIRVLANNDAPNGAAFIKLQVPLEENWEGWKISPYTPSGKSSGGVDHQVLTEVDVNAPTTPLQHSFKGSGAEPTPKGSNTSAVPRLVKRERSSSQVPSAHKGAENVPKSNKKAKHGGVVTPNPNVEPLKVLTSDEKKPEAPLTPSPTSIETVRASMTNAIQSPWAMGALQASSPVGVPLAFNRTNSMSSSIESPTLLSPLAAAALQTPVPQQKNAFDTKLNPTPVVAAAPFAMFNAGLNVPAAAYTMPVMAYLQAFQQAFMMGSQSNNNKTPPNS